MNTKAILGTQTRTSRTLKPFSRRIMHRKSSPSIVSKFTGPTGRARLVNAIAEQFIVGGNREIATALAHKVAVEFFKAGQHLMDQGAPEDGLMLILGGTVAVVVNGREIAQRSVGNHVGEMCLLDTTALRSATVRAVEPTVVAAISEEDFTRIALKHPHLWRRIALGLSQRLRERNKFHTPPRAHPTVFIGSSSEGYEAADCIYRSLRRSSVVPYLWTNGVFECSKTTIEDLVRTANSSDFAIIVLSGDDVTRSRGKAISSPRDNVVFELGLFMGALSRNRTYVVAQKGIDIKLPTDLLGVMFLTYQKQRGKPLTACLGPTMEELRQLFAKYGPK